MFLDRKGIVKCVLFTLLWVVFAALAFVDYAVFDRTTPNLIFAIAVTAYAVFIGFWSRNLFGTSRYLSLSRRYLIREIAPSKFLKEYERIRFSDKLVVAKPSLMVLLQAALAYSLLGMNKQLFATLDEMLAVAKPKQKAFALLCNADFRYDLGMTKEAERFFAAAQSEKMDVRAKILSDGVEKGGHALALGDFAVYERSHKESLEKTKSPLSRLVLHYDLAKLCERTGRASEAKEHYTYCARFGGETYIRTGALSKLNVFTEPEQDFKA